MFVHDDLGAARAHAWVSLVDDAWQQIASAQTDGDGRCSFEALEPGTYGVSAEDGAADASGLAVVAGIRVRVAIRVGVAVDPTPEGT